MDKEILNQYVEEMQHTYDELLIYIETESDDDEFDKYYGNLQELKMKINNLKTLINERKSFSMQT